MVKTKNKGIEKTESGCTDKNCIHHGKIVGRGRQFVGVVSKVASRKTAVVGWVRLFYIPKYQRYEKRRSKLQVHNPVCVNVKVGDKVRIVECRPISKTKNFVIMEKLE